MKKILCAFLVFAMSFCAISPTAYAMFPNVNFSSGTDVKFEWASKSDMNTLSPNATFKLHFSAKNRKAEEYKVIVKDGDDVALSTAITVKPGPDVEKTIGLSLDKGVHSLTISVYKNGTLIKEIVEDDVLVMEPYTSQFMDQTSKKGINTHWDRSYYYDNNELLLNAIKGMGLNKTRDSAEWATVERSPGQYNFGKFAEVFNKYKNRNLIDNYLTAFSNANVYEMEDGQPATVTSTKIMPKTAEGIKAYVKYNEAAANLMKDNGSEDGTLYVYNEPNISFSQSVVAPFDNSVGNERAGVYADLFKATSAYLLKHGYDWIDVGGMELANIGYDFVSLVLDNGAYPLMDTAGNHPYPQSGGFNGTHGLHMTAKKFGEALLKYGGWKSLQWSETGYTTTTASVGQSEEFAAAGIPRIFACADIYNIDDVMIYDLINDGTNLANTEDNFGQYTQDLRPKPSVATIAEFSTRTNGAKTLGDIGYGYTSDYHAIVYNKDGKPMIFAWLESGEKEIDFEGKADIYDVYGNLIEKDAKSIVLTDQPVYIEGADDSFFEKAAFGAVSFLNDVWLSNYPDNADVVTPVFDNAEAVLSQKTDGASVLSIIEDYKKLGLDFLAMGKDGELSELEVSQRLYELFRPLEFIVNLYSARYEGEEPEPTDVYDAAYTKAKTLYKDNVASMQYSDEILNYAKKWNKEVQCVAGLSEDNPTKAGVIAGDNLMIELFCSWFDAFTEFESITNVGLLIQIPHYNKTCYRNAEITMPMNLTNYTYNDFKGTVQCFDWNGNKIAETGVFNLSADEEPITQTVKFKVEKQDDNVFARYTLKLVDEAGEVLTEQIADIRVKDKLAVSMKPVAEATKNVRSMTAVVTNLTDEEQTVVINIKGDDNLKFGQSKVERVIPANETVEIEIPVAELRETKYHYYSFSYEACDGNGVICASQKLLVSFTSVPKAAETINPAEFDGTLVGWEDAYPAYINLPSDPTSKTQWRDAEFAARVFTKWDDEHLYILADVYDDVFYNGFSGSNMWQGDCLQVSIDADNDDSVGYSADDYELGFAKTGVGNECYVWHSPSKVPAGDVDWFKLVRNDSEKTTRYLIVMDNTVLSNVKFAENNVIGLNFALNEGDILARDDYAQFTLGTADKKNPSMYADFTFRAKNENGNQYFESAGDSIFAK